MSDKFIYYVKYPTPYYATFILKNNKVEIAFANAIRRACIADVKTVAFDKVDMIENTSSFHNEILQHRIEMIPLSISKTDMIGSYEFLLQNKDGSSIVNRAYTEREVTTDDIIVMLNGEQIDNRKVFPFRVSIVMLKTNQKIKAKTSLTIGTNVMDAKFCPVSPISYRYLTKHDVYGMNMTITDLEELDYLKNHDGTPTGFCFEVESVGSMNVDDILKEATQSILDQLNTLANGEIDTNPNVSKMSPASNTVDWTLKNFDDTIGNLIVTYANLNMRYVYKRFPEVYYEQCMVAYKKTHPLKDEIKIRIQTHHVEDVNPTPEDIINGTIHDLIGLFEEFRKDLDTFKD